MYKMYTSCIYKILNARRLRDITNSENDSNNNKRMRNLVNFLYTEQPHHEG